MSATLPSFGVVVEVGTAGGALGTDRTMLALAAQDVLPSTVWLRPSSEGARRVGDQLEERWRTWFPELLVVDAPPLPGGTDVVAVLGAGDVPYPFFVAELAELLQPPTAVAALTGCLDAVYDPTGVLRRREPPSWPPPDPAGLAAIPTSAWRWAARTRWLTSRPWDAAGRDIVRLAQRASGALRLSHRSSAERRRVAEG